MNANNRRATRREILKLALLGLGGLALPAGALAADPARFLSPKEVREELEDVLEEQAKAHPEVARRVVRETAAMHPDLVQSDNKFESIPHTDFAEELPFPPVAVPVSTTFPSKFGPADHYIIRQEVGLHEFFPNDRPGMKTPIWGFDGIFPGPTIVQPFGKPVVVTHVNRLPAPTIVHRHGGFQPREDDGNALDKIPAGASRNFEYPGRTPSNRGFPMWYHDHRSEVTANHVFLGMAGWHLFQDPVEEEMRAAGLLPRGLAGTVPREQAHDIPVILTDRDFTPDAHMLKEVKPGDKGQIGESWLANGAIRPRFSVATRKYRFRFLNANVARDWNLVLSNGMPFTQIGTDGGLLMKPVERRNLLFSSAERMDVIIDFSKVPVGTSIFLVNLFGNELWKEDDPLPIMRFDVVRAEVDDVTGPPPFLRNVEPLTFPEPGRAVRHRTFRFDRNGGLWTINNEKWDPKRDDARPLGNTVEIWDLINKSGGWAHTIHVHLELMRVWARSEDEDELAVNNAPPWEALGYKDTVRLGFNEKVRIIKYFPGDFAGAPDSLSGRYLIHCHMSDHEDHHMIGVFHVVTHGDGAGGRVEAEPVDRV